MPIESDSEPLIPQPIKTHNVLPEFTLLDLDGNPQASTQWKGKILVLNFWATWCPPCRKEIPDFIALQSELGNRGLQFVGIAIDDPAKVRDFAARAGFNYPVLLGDNRTLHLSAKLGNRLQGMPFSVIFDPNGRVILRVVGELTPETIRNRVETLLEPPKQTP
jgi:thiol-disulfide isomerase/thioredoxin